jgi:beta-glucosidase
MPPSDFKNANIDEIVEKLTTDEAINLIAGVGFWHTHKVERLGIPAVKVRRRSSSFTAHSDQHQVSDGPNGIRGNHFFMGTPAKCLPVGTDARVGWGMC